jgi:hypothetical protein
MAKKIDDLQAASSMQDAMQFETDLGGATSNKVTAIQVKNYCIDSLETTVTNQGNSIDSLETDLNLLEQQVGNNINKIDTNINDISTLQNSLNATQTLVSNNETAITNLEGDVAQNTTDISTLQNNLGYRPERTYYVSGNGDDNNSGGVSDPLKTIQAAIDLVQNPSMILVYFGSYNEDLSIVDKENIVIHGMAGPIDSQQIEVQGSVTISGSSTRIRFVNINFTGKQAGSPTVLDNGSLGRHYFTNCAISHEDSGSKAMEVNGGNNWINIDLSNIDDLTLTGSPSGQRAITCQNCVIGQAVVENALYICQAIRCSGFGPLTHSAGTIVLNYITSMPSIDGDSIVSTADSASGQLFLNNVNFQQSDLSYGNINKTGDGFYIISNCYRDVAGDNINGTRVAFNDISVDGFVGFSPSNYQPADNSLKSHLIAIDTKLGQLENQLANLLELE